VEGGERCDAQVARPIARSVARPIEVRAGDARLLRSQAPRNEFGEARGKARDGRGVPTVPVAARAPTSLRRGAVTFVVPGRGNRPQCRNISTKPRPQSELDERRGGEGEGQKAGKEASVGRTERPRQDDGEPRRRDGCEDLECQQQAPVPNQFRSPAREKNADARRQTAQRGLACTSQSCSA
jgi:hypothetical protein